MLQHDAQKPHAVLEAGPAAGSRFLGPAALAGMSSLLETSAQAGDEPGGGPLGAHAVLTEAILPSLPGDVQRALKAQLLGPKVSGGGSRSGARAPAGPSYSFSNI